MKPGDKITVWWFCHPLVVTVVHTTPHSMVTTWTDDYNAEFKGTTGWITGEHTEDEAWYVLDAVNRLDTVLNIRLHPLF